MKFISSLYGKLFSGILLFSAIFICYSVYLDHQFRKRESLSKIMFDHIESSVNQLLILKDKFSEANNLLIYWGNAGTGKDQFYRDNFDRLFRSDIFPALDKLSVLSVQWKPEDENHFKSINKVFRDSLIYSYINLINEYHVSNSGDFEVFIKNHQGLPVFDKLAKDIDYLLDKRKSEMNDYFLQSQISARNIRNIIDLFTLLIILITGTFLFWIFFLLRNHFRKIKLNLIELGEGRIPPTIEKISNDEPGEIFSLMNKLFAYLKNLKEVAHKINRKDFNNPYRPLNEKDELGTALMELQDNLKMALEEEERRKKEDSERSWSSEGIARINDILRLSSDRIDELGYSLIKEIAAFTSSQVGALYINNADETGEDQAELIAAFAYDRQKFIHQKIHAGEGLVGRCIQERETVYLTDVPENYLTIKSGLGESKPASIVIVPLLLNEMVYGVIELASFSVFEPYKIKFLETIGETIATSISKIKINLRTAQLLEQTRLQTEDMIAKEDEMRRKMEELRSTQQQSAKREEKLLKEIEELQGKK